MPPARHAPKIFSSRKIQPGQPQHQRCGQNASSWAPGLETPELDIQQLYQSQVPGPPQLELLPSTHSSTECPGAAAPRPEDRQDSSEWGCCYCPDHRPPFDEHWDGMYGNSLPVTSE